MAKAEERMDLVPRWVALLLTAIVAGLVVWTLYLTYALPARHVTDHWRIAWAGFDLGLALALATTALGVAREAQWVDATAAVSATLLVTDAWFDIVLADPGGERVEAIVLAAIGEIPLALFCVWIVLNAERAIGSLKDSQRRRP
ncbi:MAG: hypothetical protein E6G33_07400 [Actinobacteria bacterium]|nr:MAG: hypothetical protein E6G33_07400 [Actinomycetota bacterium]